MGNYYPLALVQGGLGHLDLGIKCLRRALVAREPMAMCIPLEPCLEPLRRHSEYHALLPDLNSRP
jgi:hypothetical protein